MMNAAALEQLLAHPERLDGATLSALHRLLERYPYFQTARLLYLRNLYEVQDERYEDELVQHALWLNDRKTIRTGTDHRTDAGEVGKRVVLGTDHVAD